MASNAQQPAAEDSDDGAPQAPAQGAARSAPEDGQVPEIGSRQLGPVSGATGNGDQNFGVCEAGRSKESGSGTNGGPIKVATRRVTMLRSAHVGRMGQLPTLKEVVSSLEQQHRRAGVASLQEAEQAAGLGPSRKV